MTDDWSSVHIHFAGNIYGDACDNVIRDVVGPFVKSSPEIRSYFFVRYAEGGPHLRLRFRVHEHCSDATASGLRTRLHELRVSSARSEDSRVSTHRNAAELRWIRYEPEYKRYGGVRGIRVAEAIFDASSRMAVDCFTERTYDGRAERLGLALAGMLVTLRAFGNGAPDASVLMRAYRDGNLRILSTTPFSDTDALAAFDQGYGRQAERLGSGTLTTWKALMNSAEIPQPFTRYSEVLSSAATELSTLFRMGSLELSGPDVEWGPERARLLLSYLHMMNNRLGVSMVEEAYLAHVISRALESAETTSTLP